MSVYPPPDYLAYPPNQYPPPQPVWDPNTNTYVYPPAYIPQYAPPYPSQYPLNQYPPQYQPY